MTMNKRERESLAEAIGDGDSLAAAIARDVAEEEGENLEPFWRPKRGDKVVIFTGMCFHRGDMTGEDHEYYGLAAGSFEIYETGPLADFYGKGTVKLEERVPVELAIRKGPTVKIARWLHD